MPRVKVTYLNIYYTITRNREEYIEFDEPFTLGQLLNTLSERYGSKFNRVIFKNDNKLKRAIWIMVNRVVTSDLEVKLKDSTEVIFSLPLSGG